MPNDSTPSLASLTPSQLTRRADLIQICVYVSGLYQLLTGQSKEQSARKFFEENCLESDLELGRTITDQEVADARKATAARFADVFPAGI